MININSLNQNNDYQLGKPNIQKVFSNLLMRKSNTTSGDVGKIIPIFVQEMLPNQQIDVRQSINLQFTPLVSNLLHQINAEIDHYFVPYRLVWDEWEKFITGGETGLEEPPIPSFELKGMAKYIKEALLEKQKKGYKLKNESTLKMMESILKEEKITLLLEEPAMAQDIDNALIGTNWDYLGLPLGNYITEFFIWEPKINKNLASVIADAKEKGVLDQKKYFNANNDYYFHINKLNFRAINKIYNDWVRVIDWEPEKDIDDITVGIANWNWDYFTRARRYQLRGAMPSVPVSSSMVVFQALDSSNKPNNYPNSRLLKINSGEFNIAGTQTDRIEAKTDKAQFEFDDLMTAAALMSYYTANAKIKPKYSEQLLARWGVKIQDARVQQAEYLGSEYLSITSQGIVNTANDQGQITGQIWGNGQAMQGRYRAQEHGVFISELVVKPANVYEQGVPALMKHRTKFDFATPEFINLPDQPIKKEELDPLAGEEVLGYKSIYDEYRTTTNIVTGLLRPSLKDGLKTYTLARNVDIHSKGKTFGDVVKCIPDMDRIKQYLDQPDFILIIINEVKTIIPLPYQSNPEMAL